MFNLTVNGAKGNNSKIYMSDEEIADRQHAIDCFLEEWDNSLEELRRLGELDKLCKNGKSDIASEVAGIPVSSESLNVMMRQSLEDFWSGAATGLMAAADIGTLGIAGNFKLAIEQIMETTQQLSKKLNKNLRRLKGRKIEDSDIANVRAANLRSFNSWMFRTDIILKVHAEFKKITAQNAYSQMKKIAEYCAQIGWRPRGLFKWTGIHIQSGGTILKERWAVSSDKAGKLGWNAANLQKAVGVCQKLLSIRVSDLYIDPDVQKKINELNKSGMTFKQMNKALTAVTIAAYHEIGKMVRVVNKLLTSIDADYDEDDEM